MSSIIDRVAMTIAPDAWHVAEAPLGISYTSVLWKEEQARARMMARRAMAAMHEATSEMLEAGCSSHPVAPYSAGTTLVEIIKAEWEAMIERAIDEK